MVVSPLMYTAGTIVGGITLGVIGATIWSITKRKIKPKNVAVLTGLFVSALWIVVSIARAHDHLAGMAHGPARRRLCLSFSRTRARAMDRASGVYHRAGCLTTSLWVKGGRGGSHWND